MCNPMIAIAAATTAVSAASKVVGFLGQSQQYKANEEAANFNYANRINALSQQGEQVSAQGSENDFTATLQRLQAAGRISASASDLGASSQTTTGALHGADFGIGRTESIEQLNEQSAFNQLGNEATGANISRVSQINSVAQPSIASLGLGIAGSVLGGASTFAQLGGSLTGSGGTAGESAGGDASMVP